jgi:polyvinyl alcohol dehydrogenase (cytochrome)
MAMPHWNGWGVDPAQHRFQPAAMAGLSAEQVSKLKLKWAFGFPGVARAYGQPTVVAGRVFVGSAGRKVHSLSAESSCVHWIYDADFPVRAAISVGQSGHASTVYFGDQHANAYAVDALTGRLLWKTHVEDRVYLRRVRESIEEVLGGNPKYECCTFRGTLTAIDAGSGKILWKSYTIPEEPQQVRKNKQGVQLWGPSGAGVWSSPTVDLGGHMIYATTGDSYSDPFAHTSDVFLAFDLATGKLAWSRQMTEGDAFNVDCAAAPEQRNNCPEANGPDFDFGSSPILAELAKGQRALIAGQKSGVVYALDPDKQGELLWQKRVGKGGSAGGVQWGSAVDGKNVYVAVSDAQMRPVPEGTAGAQETFFGVSFQLDPKAGGGLFALSSEKGEVVWHTPHPGCGEKLGCSPGAVGGGDRDSRRSLFGWTRRVS